MIVFASTLTPRFKYILGFFGREITGHNWEYTDDEAVYKANKGPKINYSNAPVVNDEFRIDPVGLLEETKIRPQEISCFICNSNKAFFPTTGDWPFDIFSASFYLLSRYEEYLPHQQDSYGRFAHEQSIAFREDFLHIPLVNYWIRDFRKALVKRFSSFKVREPVFELLPTYDIDEAFAYLHKPWWRRAGSVVKSLLNRKWDELAERRKVMSGQQQDPYDAFEWMHELHKRFELHPVYFFLMAGENGTYDKNIIPDVPAFRMVVKQHSDQYETGIHPSWQSGDDPGLLREEMTTLASITGKVIHTSRQHYIRMTMPATYRLLCQAGISADHSMGYGTINGFRASVAAPFFWYDLEKEESSCLVIYPFCFMDANSFYEQKLSAAQAFDEMLGYYNRIREINGTMITLWHNTFLGTSPRFQGWREMYLQFITHLQLPAVPGEE